MEIMAIENAVKMAKEGTSAKFDATIELHINLDLDSNQSVRFSASLPHGTGKTKRVAVMSSKKVAEADIQIDEPDLSKIETGEIKPKVDFDAFVAEPRYMAKVAKVAKILGPAGMMPNPKAGTVTEDVEKAVAEIKKGKMEIRTEPNSPIIHTIIGKKSFTDKQLVENFKEVVNLLKQNKPAKARPDWIKSFFINATMGTSTQVALEEL